MLPRTFKECLGIESQDRDSQPKDPDIFAYNFERNEWRFCEVKRTDQQPKDVKVGQLVGLVALHLLTKAPIAVVRMVRPERDDAQCREYPVRFRITAEGLHHVIQL